ncbi:MAG: type II secretion system protein GspI [Gammaproteobacteria bacterium]|nr:MAG: type II secretion system protein GspI [Gammaproteobacteria bacterium]
MKISWFHHQFNDDSLPDHKAGIAEKEVRCAVVSLRDNKLRVAPGNRSRHCSNACFTAVVTRMNASRLHPCGIMNSRVPFTRKNGFTLIEILVALSIIAIAMAALIKAAGNHTASAAYLKEKTLAHYVAMNEITKLQLNSEWPSNGTEKKSIEMANHEWFWTREVTAVIDPFTQKPSSDFKQVSFVIYLDEDRKQNLTRLVGYILRPATPKTN